MIHFVISSTLIWAAGLLLYQLLLRKVAVHEFTRGYLLTVLAAGVVLPWVPSWSVDVALLPSLAASTEIWLPGVEISSTAGSATNGLGAWMVSHALLLLYLVGFTLATLRLAGQCLRLRQLGRDGRQVAEVMQMRIIEVANLEAPCSWGRDLYVANWNQYSLEAQRSLLAHEAKHATSHHRLDVVFTEVCKALVWFNPLVYALSRKLRLVHEYQADEAALRLTNQHQYRRLLLAHQLDSVRFGLAASFSQSPINHRLMMFNSAYRQNQAWRLFTALVCMILVAAACTKDEFDEQELAQVAEMNTGETAEDLFMRGVEPGEDELVSVDTIVMFDPVTGEESMSIVRNYRNIEGEERSLTHDTAEGAGHELVRGEKVYKVVEDMPHFPGCDETLPSNELQRCATRLMLEHIYANVKYPDIARENSIQGTSVVSFVVGRDGELLEPTIVRSVGGGTDEEVLRVLQTMPAWVPGRQAGEEVQTRFNLPIKFKLE